MVRFLVWDTLAIAIIALAAWRGWRKGLLKTAASIVVFALSIWLATIFAGQLANPVADGLVDLLGFGARNSYSNVIEGEVDPGDNEQVREAAELVFDDMGFSERDNARLQDEVLHLVRTSSITVRNAIATVALRMVMRVVLFFFFFIVLAIILHMVLKLLNGVLESLPIAGRLNKFGGLAVGVIIGVLLLLAVAWAIRNLGMNTGAINPEESLIMGWLTQVTPFRLF